LRPLYSCHSRGNGQAGDWKANGTAEIAEEKAKVLIRSRRSRVRQCSERGDWAAVERRPPESLPPRTTGCVPGNEQCVCHRGSKSCASRRATYDLRCRAEGHKISRETIMKRRAPVLGGDALAAEIAALAKATVKDLGQRRVVRCRLNGAASRCVWSSREIARVRNAPI
jgi:hypothetical protein